MFSGIRLTVATISFFCSIIFIVGALAGTIYCKREKMPDGTVYISFTNSGINLYQYPIIYDFFGFGNIASREISEQNRDTGKTRYKLAPKSNQYSKDLQEITNRINTINNNLSGDLLERKYQLKQIEALSGSRRPLNPRGFDNGNFIERAGIEEQSKTQNLRIPSSIIDVGTGRQMIPAAGGIIDPGTGTFHTDVGGGYVNSKTGAFSPKIGP